MQMVGLQFQKKIKLPNNQQDRDMIARELLVKFQMSPKHPLVDLKKSLQKILKIIQSQVVLFYLKALVTNNSTVLNCTSHTIEYLQQKMLGTMF